MKDALCCIFELVSCESWPAAFNSQSLSAAPIDAATGAGAHNQCIGPDVDSGSV